MVRFYIYNVANFMPIFLYFIFQFLPIFYINRVYSIHQFFTFSLIAKTVPAVFVYLHKKILLDFTKTLISQNRALFFAKNQKPKTLKRLIYKVFKRFCVYTQKIFCDFNK